jgi:hypothetical protein
MPYWRSQKQSYNGLSSKDNESETKVQIKKRQKGLKMKLQDQQEEIGRMREESSKAAVK